MRRSRKDAGQLQAIPKKQLQIDKALPFLSFQCYSTVIHHISWHIHLNPLTAWAEM